MLIKRRPTLGLLPLFAPIPCSRLIAKSYIYLSFYVKKFIYRVLV